MSHSYQDTLISRLRSKSTNAATTAPKIRAMINHISNYLLLLSVSAIPGVKGCVEAELRQRHIPPGLVSVSLAGVVLPSVSHHVSFVVFLPVAEDLEHVKEEAIKERRGAHRRPDQVVAQSSPVGIEGAGGATEVAAGTIRSAILIASCKVVPVDLLPDMAGPRYTGKG